MKYPRTIACITAICCTGLAFAQEAELKDRVRAREAQIVELIASGVVNEGPDGLLKPVSTVEASQRDLMRAENSDREAIFRLIADKSKLPLEEVQSMYARRARAKFPPAAASATAKKSGLCSLKPANGADVLRLLQYLKQGIQYASQRKFDLALAEFQPALAIDPNFLGLNQNVGSAQMGLKKFDEAEAAFKVETKLVACLAGFNDAQLGNFGYFYEVPEKDPAKRKRAQTEKLKAELPKAKAAAHYNLACAYSQKRQKTEALAELRNAVDAGFSDRQALNSDPDLSFARQSPEFREIAAKVK